MQYIKFLTSIVIIIVQFNAGASELHFPLDCTLGKTCWIANLPRHFIRGQQFDYRCGTKTYDGHKGTDIALRDRKQMESGVNVLAPIAGKITGKRTRVQDISTRIEGKAAIKGKECGNGVVISDNEVQVQLCHLKQGSIVPSIGDKVEVGDVIGQVGLSGMTEYPHLHISVKEKVDGNLREVDPFYGRQIDCGLEPKSMWKDSDLMEKHASSGVVYNHGFAFEAHNAEQIRSGVYTHSQPKRPSEFIGFVDIFSVNKGDNVELSIIDPNNKVFLKRGHSFGKKQARYFFFIGKKLRGEKLVGRYTLKIKYSHKGGKTNEYIDYIDL